MIITKIIITKITKMFNGKVECSLKMRPSSDDTRKVHILGLMTQQLFVIQGIG